MTTVPTAPKTTKTGKVRKPRDVDIYGLYTEGPGGVLTPFKTKDGKFVAGVDMAGLKDQIRQHGITVAVRPVVLKAILKPVAKTRTTIKFE